MRTRILKIFLPILVIAVAWWFVQVAHAQIPQTINYQGYLTNSTSQPVNAAVNVTFRLYTASADGQPVWTETQSGIGVTNGIFNAVLGKSNPLSLPFNVPYFLSLQVNSDAEMAARQPLSAVPYAMRTATADALAAGATIPASQLTGTIAGNQLAATQLLPTSACTTNYIPQWNGSAWTCAAGTAGPQGPVGPTGPAGPTGPQGPAGSVDAATNLTLPASTATAGNIMKGASAFIHNFGTSNTFIGINAGNLALTGSGNTASGFYALSANTSGGSNTATGGSALQSNTTGSNNTANGVGALLANLSGNSNTALGVNTLVRNSSGSNNTATGMTALYFNTTGHENTANGVNALQNNTIGYENTASGVNALMTNSSGFGNTATGFESLKNNTSGNGNSASGYQALQSNTTAGANTAGGYQALQKNTTGAVNTAFGYHALYTNVGGGSNTAFGSDALQNNSTGGENTAVGKGALSDNSTGSRNIALGFGAGALHNGSDNIHIGNTGTFSDFSVIRIGTTVASFQKRTFIAGIRGIQPFNMNAVPVLIDSEDQLGTINSSRRFKDNIADMDAASSALMQLRPVTFHYKSDQNPAGRSLQYGLIAEEVAEVYPGLVAHSADGQIETVMYQHLPPMLLNEVQKQHRAIESLRVLVQTKDREIDALRHDLIAIKRKLGLD